MSQIIIRGFTLVQSILKLILGIDGIFCHTFVLPKNCMIKSKVNYKVKMYGSVQEEKKPHYQYHIKLTGDSIILPFISCI